MKSKKTGFRKRLALVLSAVMIIGLMPSTILADDYVPFEEISPAAAAAENSLSIQAAKSAETVTASLYNPSSASVTANLILAVYDPNGRLNFNKNYVITVGANDMELQLFDYDVAAHSDYTYKLFSWDPVSFAPLCKELRIGPPLVLYEKGQWAPELGEITVHTPGLDSDWAYEDGSIRITNRVPASEAVEFRFVFENLVDVRGYNTVVMELEEAPSGAFFTPMLRFRIDEDTKWRSTSHGNIIRMTSANGFMDPERLRGFGALPAYGQTVKIKKVYIEGNGYYSPATINSNAQNLMDIIPPRTGNTPVKYITISSQYYGKVEWTPDDPTFQADTVYTANITLIPKPGWKLDGLAANWFRIYYPTGGAVQLTHAAGSGVITHTFPATKEILPYPDPTQFVALSFDDIYMTDLEPLLDVMASVGIRGTLFANGINIGKSKTNPEFKRVLDKAVAAGFEFGNHAYQHEHYTNSADEDVTRENFRINQDLILELTGQTPRWSRIPYASQGTMSLRVVGEFGLTNLRGLATNDWDFPNSVSRLVNTVVTATGNNAVRDGQIYVCHVQPGQRNTVEAIPEYYHELRSRGVGFMTMSDLRAHRDFAAEPGVNYANFFQNSPTPQIITINTQPTAPPAENLFQGNISGSLTVSATAAQGAALSYQWYAASFSGNSIINGATGPTYTLPTNLTEGKYYYYCVVSAANAPSITTNVVAVPVSMFTSTAPTVLFEDGTWAPELGEVTVQAEPGGDSTWAYKDGMIEIYNGVPTTRSILFRFRFDNHIDIRGYDVVVELAEPYTGWFSRSLRFRTDEDQSSTSGNIDTNIIRMAGPSGNNTRFAQQMRGLSLLPDFDKTVKIKKISLEGAGKFAAVGIPSQSQNIPDIIPPRTGNIPVKEITSSIFYTGTVEWSPNHDVFQTDTVYTATVTLKPRPGWSLNSVSANWFRIYDRTGNDNANVATHSAGSGVLTRTFAATKANEPYPEPTQFVSISFDDVYLTDTDALLDVLDELGVKATFFAIGANIVRTKTNPAYKATLDRLVAAGHEVGSHAYYHERWGGSDINGDIMLKNFQKNQELVFELTGKTPKWFRLPYGSGQNGTGASGAPTSAPGRALAAVGISDSSCYGGLAFEDWDDNYTSSRNINRVLTATGNSSMRDGQNYVGHDQPGQTNSRNALAEIVHELRSRGFGFKTISEMAEYRDFKTVPGYTYYDFFSPILVTAKQPTIPPAQALVEGIISGSLEFEAVATQGTVNYQWFSNTSASTNGATAVDAATSSIFELPKTLTAGTYYYYCRATMGTTSVNSNVVTIEVSAPAVPAAFQM